MKKWILLFAVIIAVLFAAGWLSAQYTGFDIEQKKPATLFPVPGPGEAAIINELRTTNRLLQEQNQLIAEQNRLVRESMAKKK